MKPLNKINKLIIGLSCLGTLSGVSCDNEHSENIKSAPVLEEVNFSAATSLNGERTKTTVTFAAGDKIKVYIVEGEKTSTTPAKYYTTNDKTIGKVFTEEGTELTFESSGDNIVIAGGFFLESADSDGKKYTIKRFDIIKKDETKATYVLNEEKENSFSIVTGSENKPSVHVVSNESAVEGVEETSGKATKTAPSTASTEFAVDSEELTNKLNFKVQFTKTDDTNYNSKTDATTVIQLTISYDNNEVFKTEDLFKESNVSSKSNGCESFRITLPMKLVHYTGDFTLAASVTPSGGIARDFTIPNNASTTIKNGGTVVIKDLGSGGSKSSGSSTGGGSSSSAKSSSRTLAFVGGDFENNMNLNNDGLKNYATYESGSGINSSKALHIQTSGESKNDYVFTALAPDNLPSSYSKITFKLKGTAASKSISINLYKTDGIYYVFNLGEVTADKTITSSSSNSYTGSINASDWVTITLNLSGISDLNTDSKKSFLALKIGNSSAFNVFLDNFYIE